MAHAAAVPRHVFFRSALAHRPTTRGLLSQGILGMVGLLLLGVTAYGVKAQPLQTQLPRSINESAGLGYAGGEIAGQGYREKGPAPALAVGTPTAYGAEFGDVFGGVAYQCYVGVGIPERNDGAAFLGVGLGDARKTVGIEITYAPYDLVEEPLSDGGVSLKIHRHLYKGFAIAIGMEDMVRYGDRLSRSAYVVASQTVRISRGPLTGASATVGVGDGRFNTMSRLSRGANEASLFGGLSVQLMDRLNVLGTWHGQDLNLGLSLVIPGPVPITLTPTWVNVLNKHVDGDRFALSMGTSYRFQ